MYYQSDGKIEDMKAEDIAYFSKEFILEFASTKIDHIWDKLPIALRMGNDIMGYRRCLKHYNYVSSDYDIFDGPYPHIKNCNARLTGSIVLARANFKRTSSLMMPNLIGYGPFNAPPPRRLQSFFSRQAQKLFTNRILFKTIKEDTCDNI
ncbi:hypothetical protein PV328_011886 [Microctonus aethiopoides]|uniref:Uncharacterized protein n=1 Tax=Microctonus aethiopoides TaxID=144406 RepID=A0AA39FHK9_9HYME|nr:hypothetical protein PV328_011886 [Microctonus aethiopoides]